MRYKVLALVVVAMMSGCERERPAPAPAPATVAAPVPAPAPLSPEDVAALTKAKRRASQASQQARFEANLWSATPGAEHKLLEDCKARQAVACAQLGDASAARPHLIQGKLSTEAYKLGCFLNDGRSCRRYGEQVELGRGVSLNMRVAFAFYRRACKLEDTLACEVHRVLTFSGKGQPPQLTKFKDLLISSCEGGLEPMSCARAGELLMREANGKRAAKGQALLERACTLGAFKACNNLGSVLERAAAGDASDQRATALFTRACDAGEAEGCYNLGWMVRQGRGASRDEDRALALAERACQLGYAGACPGAVERAAP